MKNLIYILLILLNSAIFAQHIRPSIDTVISFNKGTGTTFGQDSTYFPYNIFGYPDTSAGFYVPSSNPYQILSLGLDGEIIVSFKNYFIKDGIGPDFVVYENAFFSLGTGKIFCEPAIVSVSKDGNNFYTFPYDTLTLAGLAGTYPTIGEKFYTDFDSSGGNWFDLSDINIDSIKYIKIKDISRMLKNPAHPRFDFMVNGFDLDAIVLKNFISITTKISIKENQNNDGIYLYPNPISKSKNGNVNLKLNSAHYFQSITIFNSIGQEIEKFNNLTPNEIFINISRYPTGIYFLNIKLKDKILTRKFLIME